MSLGDVDYPYLEQIKRRWPNVMWRFSFFSKQDEDRIDVVAKKLGVSKKQYKKFNFQNDESENIEMEIVNSLGIVTYEPVENPIDVNNIED